MLDFKFLMDILSRIDTKIFDDSKPSREDFITQLSDILIECDLSTVEILRFFYNRSLTFEEVYEIEVSNISKAEIIANNIVKDDFRMTFPNYLKNYFGVKIDYLLHIPKTGGQSFTDNLYDYGYAVWDIDRAAHRDYVYDEIPNILNKIQNRNTLIVHSHMFWTHVQNHINISQGDRVICLYRGLKSLHISNANYIIENLISDNVGAKIINDQWTEFLPLISRVSKVEDIVRILNSNLYFTIYSNIFSKYFFGENFSSIKDYNGISKIIASAVLMIKTDNINEFLCSDYDVINPRLYNAAKGHRYSNEEVISLVEWERLCSIDNTFTKALFGEIL